MSFDVESIICLFHKRTKIINALYKDKGSKLETLERLQRQERHSVQKIPFHNYWPT